MQAADIIARKRDGEELTTEEINWFIQGVTEDALPDYQIAAWLMAVYIRGMSRRETLDLAQAMAHSGAMLDLSGVVDFAVDKHSSGGVGDKTTLVVLPLVVACGVPVGKMSGRGLGFSGGTLDKMESIPGFRAELTTQEFLDQLAKCGIVLSGQSADLAPADGKLYALRDVTATVGSLPLIATSIMSKKLAAGADAIVLDVKAGSGAFMSSVDEARRLAGLMLDIGRMAGRKMVALISDMSQPLGRAVGNALEVQEAIETLHGGGPGDLVEHCLVTTGHMLRLAGVGESLDALMPAMRAKLQNGAAFAAFRTLVQAQGGDAAAVDDPDDLPRAGVVKAIPAPRRGYIAQMDARAVGDASMLLGAGRRRKGDPVDHAVGVVLHAKVGDYVEAGQPLFTVHANDLDRLAEAERRLMDAPAWHEEPVKAPPLFYDVLEVV
ncbi:MAG: thymidine phosphorylase [Anaerolineae bacterium]|nr:thymidine phosphorylase [Anaerolineae bacterium]